MTCRLPEDFRAANRLSSPGMITLPLLLLSAPLLSRRPPKLEEEVVFRLPPLPPPPPPPLIEAAEPLRDMLRSSLNVDDRRRLMLLDFFRSSRARLSSNPACSLASAASRFLPAFFVAEIMRW